MSNQHIDMAVLRETYQQIQKRFPNASPKAGIILGSGWSDAVSDFTIHGTIDYSELKGLGATSIAGHAGKLLWASIDDVECYIFQGRRHTYEGTGWTPIAIPPFIVSAAGASHLLITNAAGGIRPDLHPGMLMLITDHINMMGGNPLIGPHLEEFGPRFPDQSHIYNPDFCTQIQSAASDKNIKLTEGIYLAASGPTYETPAEIQAYKRLGADAVGMSTVPEAILGNAAGLQIGGISCITNYAAGISSTPLTHEEVTQTTSKSMPLMTDLLPSIIRQMKKTEKS